MAHFYRQLLERSEEEHLATVAATTQSSQPTIGPQGPNLTITKPLEFASKSDAELAHAARAKGKEVELNDDNQIVDKRELLSAGLNLAAPNTRHLGGLRTSRTKTSTEGQEVQTHRATGAAASRREINERRARELERQIAEEQERLTQQKEREEQEERERTVAKRNSEEAIENARVRYLERKRRKLEDGMVALAGD
jgi:coiled-coil domain-containing protein 55